ncbi:HAD-IA family hydrolase [Streptomyces murinus]|uniref:HAD-IA family hydrolase n=1 Tax=Streptomyces murinus TaxID=33900 RepID=UPI0038139621
MSTRPPAQTTIDVLIFDYNGVIGLQPEPSMWTRLADLAGWPVDQVQDFTRAFWSRRAAYDAGEITDHDFWNGLLRGGRAAPPGSSLLDTLRRTDTAMWTRTDPAMLHLLQTTQASGIPAVLLSNAPHPLADELDRAPWCATLISKTVYSARLGVNKPAARAYEAALAAAGWPPPERTLFVDNFLENCQAAARVGIQTHHYTGDLRALLARLPQAVATSVVPAMPAAS